MNNYFQFKQFTIYQDKCAMKVCTDACLFGAWVAKKLEKKEFTPRKIMDIGCGTGLLSLMLAQKTSADIDAIEIDAEAYLQATENITASKFKNQINTFHGPVEMFAAHSKYDFIICNPPFYEHQLKANDAAKNAAMHETTLTLKKLCDTLDINLAIAGNAAILLPYDSVNSLNNLLNKKGFFINTKTEVQHSPTHPFFRSMIIVSKTKNAIINEKICIKTEDGNYSPDFIAMLNNYYLHL